MHNEIWPDIGWTICRFTRNCPVKGCYYELSQFISGYSELQVPCQVKEVEADQWILCLLFSFLASAEVVT